MRMMRIDSESFIDVDKIEEVNAQVAGKVANVIFTFTSGRKRKVKCRAEDFTKFMDTGLNVLSVQLRPPEGLRSV